MRPKLHDVKLLSYSLALRKTGFYGCHPESQAINLREPETLRLRSG